MDILITAVISLLILVAEHYLPWREWFKRDLPYLPRYVLGTLAMNGPLSALFALRGEWHAVLAVLAVTASGGIVVAAYLIDSWNKARAKVDGLQREKEIRHGHPRR